MGLYDNIVIPEDIELPEFPYDPHYVDDNKRVRLWQTKDLNCGQDRYRLRKIDNGQGSHQLERRVPPIQKMTEEGNEILDNDILWWNVVRPTRDITITEVIHNTIYEYSLSIVNGTLRKIEIKDIHKV